MTIELLSIEAEAAACRAAWASVPDAEYGAHIHHEVACEEVDEPIENRIAYILAEKPVDEQALRLRLMRPVSVSAYKAYSEAVATARKAYDRAVAPARKAYAEAVATASRAYAEAVATARGAYAEAVATASKVCDEAVVSASKAYDEAVAPAIRAYNEAVATARGAYAEAVVPARKAYDEAVLSVHRLICDEPGCPFDGRTIFPEDAHA